MILPDPTSFCRAVTKGRTRAQTRSMIAAYERLFAPAIWIEMASTWQLSPRETQIAILLCRGVSSRHAAKGLGIAENTVKKHRKAIYQKLGAHGLEQAMVKMILSTGLL